MLKGLKVKKHKTDDEPKKQKKWKKTEEKNNEEESKPLSNEEYIANQERKLLKLCDSAWSAFLDGNAARSVKACEELYISQKPFFERVFKGEKYTQKQFSLFNEDEMKNQQSDINLSSQKSLNFDKSELDQKIKADKIKNLKKMNYDNTAIEFFKKYKGSQNVEEMINNEYDDTQISRIDADQDKNKKKSKKDEKYEERKEKRENKQEKKEQRNTEKILSSCKYCLSNNGLIQEQIISLGTSTMLILPQYQRYDRHFNVQILPMEHYESLTELDEEVYDEMRNFMKCLVAAFDKLDQDVIFLESAVNLKNLPHTIVDVIGMPRKMAAQSELYFRQGIDDLDGNWSVHRKRIEIRKDKGGIQKQIPKNFPYFYVDFGMKYGFAHVIEDESKFSKTFAHEIVGTILHYDKPKILHPERQGHKELFKKKIEFQKIFEQFDWTKML